VLDVVLAVTCVIAIVHSARQRFVFGIACAMAIVYGLVASAFCVMTAVRRGVVGAEYAFGLLFLEMAIRLGLEVTLAIVQTNTVGHTRAGGFHRLAFQPTFDGQVEAGRDHVLVDDHVGLGSTLANLRGHIESHGGTVVLATTLSASRRSEVLALRAATLHSLSDKHGELDKYWRHHVGFGIDVLTEAEARYLLRAPSVDAIRAGVAQARGG